MKIIPKPAPGRKGKTVLTALHDGETVHVDTLDLGKVSDREKFVAALTDKCQGLDADDIKAIERDLLDKAGRQATKSDAPPAPRDPLADTSAEVRDAALVMLRDPDLIECVVNDVAALGVAGEKTLAATLYVVGTSRLLAKPLSAIVQGLTSSGKSYVIDVVARLFPPESVIRAHRITQEALVHMPQGALVHRFVVGGERSRRQDDESADSTRSRREMISDGCLTKLIATRTPGGQIETIQINQPGPIAYVESTTLQQILDEDRNRCLVLATDETPAQTQRINRLLAQRIADSAAPDLVAAIIEKHHAAQRSLHRCHVVVPFAPQLAECFAHERTDARRAFGHLLSAVQAVAFLHQYQRVDEPADGVTIQATADDYKLARRLVAGPFARAQGDGLSDAARHFGERLAERFANGVEFDTNDAKKRERVIGDVQTVRRYVKELAEVGFLDQTQPPKGPKAARYCVAAQPRDDGVTAGLPEVAEIFGGG